jgi:hypothetical protein
MALAPLIIRWTRTRIERHATRLRAVHRVRPQGATLKHPGWKNGYVECEPFPVE